MNTFRRFRKNLKTLSGDDIAPRSKYDSIFAEMRDLKPGNRIELLAPPEKARLIRNALSNKGYRHHRTCPDGYRFSYRILEDRLVITLKPYGKRKAT